MMFHFPLAMIKKILKGIVDSKTDKERMIFWEQLQPVITFANIANDECDFGTSLELGLNLFTYGSPLLHRTVGQLLSTAYNLLGRPEFAEIIQVSGEPFTDPYCLCAASTQRTSSLVV